MIGHNRGFTLAELTITLVLMGILATYVTVKAFDTDVFEANNFSDQVKATIRFAQKLAIAERTRPIYVNLSANIVQICYDPACTSAVPAIIGSGVLAATAPSGVVMAPSTALFRFNGLGQTNLATAATIIISDARATTALSITVEPDTGYVH